MIQLSKEACRDEVSYPACRCTSCFHTATFSRLSWAHGVERARQMIAGIDDAFNADLAAWQNIGAKKLKWEPDFD